MSRVGLLPIKVPSGVSVTVKNGEVSVAGPKGELKRRFDPAITIKQKNDTLVVTRPTDSKMHRSLHGLVRSLTANMVQGVTVGFEKVLDIVGVGYRAEKVGEKLVVRVGFSHAVEIESLPGATLQLEGANRIKVSGIDKQVVGQMAAQIRAVRPPDSYKGKGIRYAGEVVRLKAGKAVGKVEV
jgi:large subunit ribosomal protein L6